MQRYTHWGWVDEETHIASLADFVQPEDMQIPDVISFLSMAYIPPNGAQGMMKW